MGLGADCRPVLWRAGGTDCGDASDLGRGKALAGGRAVSACVELLHAVARPRGAAIGDLYRLVDAWGARGADCRPVVHFARRSGDHGAELGLRDLGQCRLCLGGVFRDEGGGAGAGVAGRGAAGQAGAERAGAAGCGGAVLCGDLCLWGAVSADRGGGGGWPRWRCGWCRWVC